MGRQGGPELFVRSLGFSLVQFNKQVGSDKLCSTCKASGK